MGRRRPRRQSRRRKPGLGASRPRAAGGNRLSSNPRSRGAGAHHWAVLPGIPLPAAVLRRASATAGTILPNSSARWKTWAETAGLTDWRAGGCWWLAPGQCQYAYDQGGQRQQCRRAGGTQRVDTIVIGLRRRRTSARAFFAFRSRGSSFTHRPSHAGWACIAGRALRPLNPLSPGWPGWSLRPGRPLRPLRPGNQLRRRRRGRGGERRRRRHCFAGSRPQFQIRPQGAAAPGQCAVGCRPVHGKGYRPVAARGRANAERFKPACIAHFPLARPSSRLPDIAITGAPGGASSPSSPAVPPQKAGGPLGACADAPAQGKTAIIDSTIVTAASRRILLIVNPLQSSANQ